MQFRNPSMLSSHQNSQNIIILLEIDVTSLLLFISKKQAPKYLMIKQNDQQHLNPKFMSEKTLPELSKPSLQQITDEDSTSSERAAETKISQIQVIKNHLNQQFGIVCHLGSTVSNSDRIVRFCGTVLKNLKVFDCLSDIHKFDKLSYQLMMARRVFRMNRKWFMLKEIKHLFITKFANVEKIKSLKPLEIFEFVFKLFILFADFNDLISYSAQLKIFQTSYHQQMKQLNLNFYFYQSFIWLILHSIQLYKIIKNRKPEDHEAIKAKILIILKYICDTLISYNDYTGKIWSPGPKTISITGLISSLIGIQMIWK